jgi:serine/threonine protein kinase
MSPEQVDGGTSDERSDIYSLGCVMYHMLTGAPPFKAESAMAVMRMHLDAEPASLEARTGGIAPGLSHIVERCMAKRPADRYMTAAELYQGLKGNAAGKSEWDGVQRYEIGDEDGTPEEQLSAREMARAMLEPEVETAPELDKVCRNCGLGAESNRVY